jgi:hypothetical protein
MGILKYFSVASFVCVLLSSTVALAIEKSGEEPVSVCISCHLELGDEMAKSVTLWKMSIHYQAGNSCEGCHGGDPADSDEAMNPEKGFVGSPKPNEISAFCGKCHVGVKENYIKSPHHETAIEGGVAPTCVTCHKSHDVKKASFELISEELCSQCHSYENGQKIKKAFISAEMALQQKKETLRYLGQRGMKTRSVLEDLNKIEADVQTFEKRIRKRWWIGGGIAGFLIILIILLYQLLRTYEEEE